MKWVHYDIVGDIYIYIFIYIYIYSGDRKVSGNQWGYNCKEQSDTSLFLRI